MEITTQIVWRSCNSGVEEGADRRGDTTASFIRWAHQISRQSAMDSLQGRTLLLLLTTAVATSAYTVRIGVLNGPGSDRRLSNEKLWSFGRDQTSAVALEPVAYDILTGTLSTSSGQFAMQPKKGVALWCSTVPLDWDLS
ncbi:hypothetical protein CEXT_31831 [Caerostris extrusa]|uniref:Uncharacterized protein n=1 Tax=Caerostris extrusa TaxID=172846 RepID=A0AAV4SFY9_CAEEX|nr:hypothetical protein CEXT_31831 [Caerostris extrusa]